jgi:hypothetical protein
MNSIETGVGNQSKSARLLTTIHGLYSIEERLEFLLTHVRGEIPQPVADNVKEPMPEQNLDTLLMAGPELILQKQERIHSLIGNLEEVIG